MPYPGKPTREGPPSWLFIFPKVPLLLPTLANDDPFDLDFSDFLTIYFLGEFGYVIDLLFGVTINICCEIPVADVIPLRKPYPEFTSAPPVGLPCPFLRLRTARLSIKLCIN